MLAQSTHGTGTVDQKVTFPECFRKFRVTFRNTESGKILQDHFPDAAVQLARPEPYPAPRQELPGEVQKAGRVRDITDIFRLPASAKENIFQPDVFHVPPCADTPFGGGCFSTTVLFNIHSKRLFSTCELLKTAEKSATRVCPGGQA